MVVAHLCNATHADFIVVHRVVRCLVWTWLSSFGATCPVENFSSNL